MADGAGRLGAFDGHHGRGRVIGMSDLDGRPAPAEPVDDCRHAVFGRRGHDEDKHALPCEPGGGSRRERTDGEAVAACDRPFVAGNRWSRRRRARRAGRQHVRE